MRLFKVVTGSLVGVLVVAGVFLLGYLFAVSTDRQDRIFSESAPNSELTSELRGDIGIFWEAWELLQANFYSGPTEVHKLMRGAIKGMVNASGDPYTEYLDAEQMRLTREHLEGRFVGVGISVRVSEQGYLLIDNPLPGSPAEASGILAGDLVIKIDGSQIRGKGLREITSKIRGERGTTVVLTIMRDEAPNQFDIRITRDEIKVPSIVSRIIDGIGYLRITSFGNDTASDLKQQLQTLTDSNVQGLIIDLRNNPGGLLDSAIDVSSQFLPEQTVILIERSRDDQVKEFRVSGGRLATELPVVVLVNGGTASAAEIVAGALQDHKRATLIGSTTFGKGSVQRPFPLSDDSAVKVTIATWMTPNGQHLDGEGIQPDFDLSSSKQPIGREEDNHVQAALRILRGELCCEDLKAA